MELITLDDFCINEHPKVGTGTYYRVISFIAVLNDMIGQGVPLHMTHKKSGFRDWVYEKEKGRSAIGTHTFGQLAELEGVATGLRQGQHLGAADITSPNLAKLAMMLVIASPFRRICFYPDHAFFHVDYIEEPLFSGQKLYLATYNKKGQLIWNQTDYDTLMQAAL